LSAFWFRRKGRLSRRVAGRLKSWLLAGGDYLAKYVARNRGFQVEAVLYV